MEKSVPQRLGWISKTKGFAILGIVAIHTIARFNITGAIFKVASQGLYCVQLFFIISAYLTFKSLDRKHHEKWTTKKYIKYLIYKSTRLFPCLLTMAIWQFIIYADSLGTFPNLQDSIWTKEFFAITLLNGFSYNYINPWGNWYVGILIQFIALAPLLHRLVHTPKSSVYLFITSILISSITTFTLKKFGIDTSWYFYFWLPNQFPAMAIGIMLYIFQKDFTNKEKVEALKFLAFFLSLFFILSMFTKSPLEEHIQWGLFLLVFSYTLFTPHWKLFNWLEILGENSYGIYLYHLCILFMYDNKANLHIFNEGSNFNFLIFYIIIISLSLLLAKLSNIMLEKPFFRLVNYFLTTPCKKSS